MLGFYGWKLLILLKQTNNKKTQLDLLHHLFWWWITDKSMSRYWRRAEFLPPASSLSSARTVACPRPGITQPRQFSSWPCWPVRRPSSASRYLYYWTIGRFSCQGRSFFSFLYFFVIFTHSLFHSEKKLAVIIFLWPNSTIWSTLSNSWSTNLKVQ